MSVSLSDKIQIRSSNINLLRFFCAVAVIICHSYAVTSGQEDFVSRFTNVQCNLGGIAVAVFFFLSGLYVAKSLEKSNSIWLFLRKRCERIFPALWIVVFLSVIMGAVISTFPLLKYLTEKETYFYLFNGFLIPVHDLPGVFEGMPYSTVNGSLWTLPVEFVCYIGLALSAVLTGKVLKDRNKRKWIEICATGALLVLFIFLWFRTPDSMLVSVVRPMIIFFEGVLYYEYREKIRLNLKVAGIAFFLFVLLGFTPFFNMGLIVFFPYGILTLALATPQVKHNLKLFSISYEMFLVGWPIQQVVMMLCGKMSPLVNWLVTLPIDILIGWIVYKAVAMIMQDGENRKRKDRANENHI